MHRNIVVKLARLIIVQISYALAYLRLLLAHLAEVAECAKALLSRGRRRVDVDATGGKASQVTQKTKNVTKTVTKDTRENKVSN